MDDRPWTLTKRAFAALIALFTFHGLINGLVWAYGFTALRPLLPIVASLLPILTWFAFKTLSASNVRPLSWRILVRLLPALTVVICMFVFPPLVDLIILLQFFGYGIALIYMASAGPDQFQQSVLHRSFSAMRASQLAGILLILNALIDIGIVVDFQMTGGQNFFGILSVVSILILMFLGIAAVVGLDSGKSVDDDEDETTNTALIPLTEDDHETLRQVESFLAETRIYLDPELTLAKLSKKLRIGSRDISNAINRHHGINVSQYINKYRLDEACRLMQTTDDSITNIHLDSGFQTKSNFNREFKRGFGMSPTEWRKAEKTKTA